MRFLLANAFSVTPSDLAMTRLYRRPEATRLSLPPHEGRQ